MHQLVPDVPPQKHPLVPPTSPQHRSLTPEPQGSERIADEIKAGKGTVLIRMHPTNILQENLFLLSPYEKIDKLILI